MLKRNKIITQIALLFSGILLPIASHAINVKFCTKWQVEYNDSGHGEDLFPTTNQYSVNSQWAHYEVRRNSDNYLEDDGILDSNGCTPELSLSTYTEYKFRQATKVERAGNRKMYIEYSQAGDYGAYYTWLNSIYTTTNVDIIVYLDPNWQTYQSNITAIAAQALSYYSTREYPADTPTYIWPNPNHDTSFLNAETHNIAIDLNWLHMQGTPQYGMNHADYKFAVAHEMGHHQAQETGGPLQNNYDITYPYDSYPYLHKCNCNQFAEDYRMMCFQSQEYIGTAESEAWAYFYSTAIFNDRTTNCGMGYFRAMYVGTTPQNATLDELAPITVNCAATPKWMESLCSDAERGVLQDWLGFYWNLWTTGDSFTIDEMTNVWSVTPGSGSAGQTWNNLLLKVQDLYDDDLDKIDHFYDTGDFTGVNH